MIREKLVILGGTGSGIIVADAAKVSTRAFDVIGFLNDREPRGSSFSGIPVLGGFETWSDCPAEVHFISAFPKAKEAFARFARLVSLGIPDDRWATVIHPAAQVAQDARLGPGSFVGAAAVVEPGWSAENTCASGAEVTSATTFDWAITRSSDPTLPSSAAAPSARAHMSQRMSSVARRPQSASMPCSV
jgi:hypothetical protein